MFPKELFPKARDAIYSVALVFTIRDGQLDSDVGTKIINIFESHKLPLHEDIAQKMRDLNEFRFDDTKVEINDNITDVLLVIPFNLVENGIPYHLHKTRFDRIIDEITETVLLKTPERAFSFASSYFAPHETEESVEELKKFNKIVNENKWITLTLTKAPEPNAGIDTAE